MYEGCHDYWIAGEAAADEVAVVEAFIVPAPVVSPGSVQPVFEANVASAVSPVSLEPSGNTQVGYVVMPLSIQI